MREGESLGKRFRDLVEGSIPSAVVVLVAVLVVYILYIRGLTPEQELQQVIRHSYFIDDIRKGISTLQERINGLPNKPDIIIAFNRTGGVAAGMLSVQAKTNIEQVLVVPRQRREPPPPGHRYIVGEPIARLNTDWFKGKTVAIAAFLVDTWETISDGLAFLSSKKVTFEGCDTPVFTVFATPRAVKSTPSGLKLFYAIEDENARQKLNQLPWVLKEYGYV